MRASGCSTRRPKARSTSRCVCRRSRPERCIAMRKLIALLFLALGAFAQEPAPDPKQLVREGVALFDAGRFDEAIAKYKAALAIDPKDGTATYELALAYAQKGDYKGCVATLQPIADAVREPADVNRLVMLGNCLD